MKIVHTFVRVRLYLLTCIFLDIIVPNNRFFSSRLKSLKDYSDTFELKTTFAILYIFIVKTSFSNKKLIQIKYFFLVQIPPMVNYSMQGRTYRYLTSDPLYPFGYGLSYSTFAYSSLKLKTPAVEAMQNLSVSISVQNTGPVDSDEVC